MLLLSPSQDAPGPPNRGWLAVGSRCWFRDFLPEILLWQIKNSHVRDIVWWETLVKIWQKKSNYICETRSASKQSMQHRLKRTPQCRNNYKKFFEARKKKTTRNVSHEYYTANLIPQWKVFESLTLESATLKCCHSKVYFTRSNMDAIVMPCPILSNMTPVRCP